MKKIAAILLVGVILTNCVSCVRNDKNNGDKNDTQNTAQDNTQNDVSDTAKGTEESVKEPKVKDAEEILTKIWNTYEASDTDNNMYNDRFPILGGHYESYSEEAPGQYDISKAEDLQKSMCFPAEKIGLIDDAATMVHLMNANTFSAGVYHVKDEADMNEVVKAIEDCITKNQWLDGEPDELLIVTIGNHYVLSAFGEDELIAYFKAGIQKAYGDFAKIVLLRELD